MFHAYLTAKHCLYYVLEIIILPRKISFRYTFFTNFAINMEINILSEDEKTSLRQYITEAQHIVICCHKSPDGDALGSSLGWAEFLRQLGKEPIIAVPDAYPDFLQWLPGIDKVVRYDKHKEDVTKFFTNSDLIFCLDFNGLGRLDRMQEALPAGSQAKMVMIDHHPDPVMQATVSVSHPELSSTSELIFRVIWQLGGFDKMTKQCAEAIYCGMMTDTGGFTYNSSHPEIYFIICQLLTKGIDKDKIYRSVFNNYSPWAIRLRGYLMSQKLNVLAEFHSSYFTMTRQEMKQYHFIKGDAEGLVNEPLKIKGLKLSISMREDDRHPNLIWISLRSVDDFPCNKMAEDFFEGGGHANASGGKLRCSMEEAERIVRQAITAYSQLLKS